MIPFKFLRSPIIKAHDGGYIYPEQYFYTMNKEELTHTHRGGKISVTPKYTIVTRFLPKIYRDKFKPDYNTLWYFRSKSNAEYLKRTWETQDGNIFNEQAEIRITFNRQVSDIE